MPDMRDAIAQYLAYTGGQAGGQMPPGMMAPRPGLPSNRQGYPLLPSGQSLPTPISDTGPMPGMPPSPPMGGYGVGPDTGPGPGAGPPGGVQMPPMGGYGIGPDTGPPPNVGPPGAVPGSGQPVVDQFIEPPVNTPMQVPGGPQVGGMDQAEWYRMYTGGR